MSEKRKRINLDELLELPDNSLSNKRLVIRDTDEAVQIMLPGNKVEHIDIFIDRFYLILDGTNNAVKTIVLHKPKTVASFKNINGNCQIVVNEQATIESMMLRSGEIRMSTLEIDTREVE